MFPDIDGGSFFDEEESGVLGERVREFEVAVLGDGRRDPEREDSFGGIGLGFEGIGIESGGIVGDLEVMEPVEITEHES